MRLAPGTRIGPYEVLGELGAGGMSVVYRVHDDRLGRDVAIKFLHGALATEPTARARFEREARAVAALSHPNILAIHDVGDHEGQSYLVTELLEGETLRGRMDRSPLGWSEAARIAIAVANGVAAAHARGLVHRDLKPDNVFLTSDGQVKILDFGLAGVRGGVELESTSQESTLTRPGTLMGTVGYMSPEQVRGETANAPSDVFSFGCVLYEMMTGRRPFAEESAVQTLHAILEKQPVAAKEVAEDVPLEVDDLIERCLEKNPAVRTITARDLADSLTKLLETGGAPVPLSESRSYRGPALAAGVLGLVVVAVLASGVLRGPAGSHAPPEGVESLAVLPLENLSADPAARDAYMQAIYLQTTDTTAESVNQAIDLAEEAIRLSPDFAPAHALLARALIGRRTYVAPEEAQALEQRAFASLERALDLDPELADAYVARAELLWTHSHRFAHARAVQQYRRALQSNPGLDLAHEGLARIFVHVGFFDEALLHVDRALELNPSNGRALHHRSEALVWRGSNQEALEVLTSIPRHLHSELVSAHTAWALARLQRFDEAQASLQRSRDLYPDDPTGVLTALDAVFQAPSNPEVAQRQIEKAIVRVGFNPSHHTEYFVGSAWAQMGRADEAVRFLRQAAENGFPCLPLLQQDPNLDPIRNHPAFETLIAHLEQRIGSLREEVFPQDA